ncbi:STAS domain-containing protein [Streptomyces sp. NPDC050732]|uniref:STAS domain-containing protein n=1 Tax=Streptomyces sp. NPDC050732 TaxID=3154632 RepID=UPI00343E9BEB
MSSSTPTTSCVESVHAHGRDLVVSLRGEIDVSTAPAITSYLDTLTTAHGAGLLIDLRQVTFMDGSGVRVLTRARARQGGRLRLICTQSITLRLLRHPSLRLHFEILDRLPPPAPRTVA